MSRAQTFVVTATPRQRFRLSQLLMSPELKFRRKTLPALARAREALALVGVTEVGLSHKRVSEKRSSDGITRHRFHVSAETAEFLIEQIDRVELTAYDALVLEPLVAQLADGKDAGDADTAADLVEAAELPHWKPDLTPIVEDPAHFIEVLGELLKRAKDLPELAALYAEAMKEEDASPAA